MWIEKEPEENLQYELFDDVISSQKWTILLPANDEHDVHHHFTVEHNRDDIRYKILERFDDWKQAEAHLSSPTITAQSITIELPR